MLRIFLLIFKYPRYNNILMKDDTALATKADIVDMKGKIITEVKEYVDHKFVKFEEKIDQKFVVFEEKIEQKIENIKVDFSEMMDVKIENLLSDFRDIFSDRTVQQNERLLEHDQRLSRLERKAGLAV